MLIVVMVLPLGRHVSPEVEGADLVQSLRAKIEALAAPLIGAADVRRLSAAPAYQAIYCSLDKSLIEDDHALSEYGIQKESDLKVILRMVSPRLCIDVGGLHSIDLETIRAIAGSRLDLMFAPLSKDGQPGEGNDLVIEPAAAGPAGAAQLDAAQLEEREAAKATLEEMGEDTRAIDAEIAEITARLAERERECGAIVAATAEGVPYVEAAPLPTGEDGAYLRTCSTATR